LEATGFRYGNLRQVTKSKLVLTCHGCGAIVQCRLQLRMADDGLRPRVCRNCGTLFFLCASCDRGQRYCSLLCRRYARLRQQRCATRRHQQSPEGRLDHRDRQRRYRRRQIKASVTDQGSLSVAYSASCGSGCFEPEAAGKITPALLPRCPVRQAGVRVCCHRCGRPGRWIDPFPPVLESEPKMALRGTKT
jgi:hypothetical protein